MLQFPTDAITKHFDIPANGTNIEILPPGNNYTILYFNFGSDPTKAMKLWLYCGQNTVPNEIIETHGQSLISMPTSFFCGDRIAYTLTGYGGQGGHVVLTYVDRDISLEPTSLNQMNDYIQLFQQEGHYYQTQTRDAGGGNPWLSGGILFSDIFYGYIIFLVLVFVIARSIIKMFYGRK